jgi:hypothetical protein
MQTAELSQTPFGSSGVTSATIDNLTMRITILEEKMKKVINTSNPITTTQINIPSIPPSAPSVPPSILPPTQTTPDLSTIFPKTGGRRKKTVRRKNRRT